MREKHGFFDVAGTPELCAEVTLQPVRRHGVDAAVLFADIMSPVLGMGIDVKLVEGVGPVIDSPMRSAADVERLRVAPRRRSGARRSSRRCGSCAASSSRSARSSASAAARSRSPAISSRGSRAATSRGRRRSCTGEPAVWHALMERLADQFAPYVAALAAAGADVIQLFDSWVGVLSPSDYVEFVAPYSQRVLEAAGVPTIHFGTGATEGLLAQMAHAGGDAIGVDWRIPLDVAREIAGDRAVQGNLDPAAAARAVGARRDARRATSSRAAAGRGTSSTSVTASCRRPIPTS